MKHLLAYFVVLSFTGLLFAQVSTDIDRSSEPSESIQETQNVDAVVLQSGEYFLVPAPYFYWLESLPSLLDDAHNQTQLVLDKSVLLSTQFSTIQKLTQSQAQELITANNAMKQQQQQIEKLSRQKTYWKVSCLTVAGVSLTGLCLYFLISKLPTN